MFKKFLLLILFSILFHSAFSQQKYSDDFSYNSQIKLKEGNIKIFFIKKPMDHSLYLVFIDSVHNQTIIIVDKTMDKKGDELYLFINNNKNFMVMIRENVKNSGKDKKFLEEMFSSSDKLFKREYKKMLRLI